MACSSPSDAPCTAKLVNVESVAPCFSYRYSCPCCQVYTADLHCFKCVSLYHCLHFIRFDHTQVVKTCQEASSNQHAHAGNLSLLVAWQPLNLTEDNQVQSSLKSTLDLQSDGFLGSQKANSVKFDSISIRVWRWSIMSIQQHREFMQYNAIHINTSYSSCVLLESYWVPEQAMKPNFKYKYQFRRVSLAAWPKNSSKSFSSTLWATWFRHCFRISRAALRLLKFSTLCFLASWTPQCPRQSLWIVMAPSERLFKRIAESFERQKDCKRGTAARFWSNVFRKRRARLHDWINSKAHFRNLICSRARRPRCQLCRRSTALIFRNPATLFLAIKPLPFIWTLRTAWSSAWKRFHAWLDLTKAWIWTAAARRTPDKAWLKASTASRFRKTRLFPTPHVCLGIAAYVDLRGVRGVRGVLGLRTGDEGSERRSKSKRAAEANWPLAASDSTWTRSGLKQINSLTACLCLSRTGNPTRLTSIACSTPWYCNCCTTALRSKLPAAFLGFGLIHRTKCGSVERIRSMSFCSSPLPVKHVQ